MIIITGHGTIRNVVEALKGFPRLLFDSVKTVAMVMFLIGSASASGYFLAYLRIPAIVTSSYSDSRRTGFCILC